MAIWLVGPLQDGLSPQRIPAARPRAAGPPSRRPATRANHRRCVAPPNSAPAESACAVQGCGRGRPGSRVQLNGFWKRLAMTGDGWRWLAIAGDWRWMPASSVGCRTHAQLSQLHNSQLHKRRHSPPWRASRAAAGAFKPCATWTGQRAHSCRRACQMLQRMHPGPVLAPHRSSGGNAAIAAETPTRAATRMRFQSCDFHPRLSRGRRCDGASE